MATPQEFLTSTTIGQYAVGVMTVSAVSRVVECLCKSAQPGIIFGIALLIAYLSAGASGSLTAAPWHEIPKQAFFSALLAWLLPAFNGCLLFIAAFGASRLV